MRWLDSMTDSVNMNLSKRQVDSEGQRNLAGCIPWGHKESGTVTEQLIQNLPTCLFPPLCPSVMVQLPSHVE